MLVYQRGPLVGDKDVHLGYFTVFFGNYTIQVYDDYFINHDIRIPSLNNQDSMGSKGPRVFSRGSVGVWWYGNLFDNPQVVSAQFA